MSLTAARGPLGPDPSGRFNAPMPRGLVYVEPFPRRVRGGWFEEEERVFVHPRNPYHRVDCIPTGRRLRVEVAGEVLVDTTHTIGVYESSLAPRLYVARAHVRVDLLAPSATSYRCVYKGLASFWHARVGDTLIEDVAWTYDETTPECANIRGLFCFDTARAGVREELAPGGEP